jgi:hypothetical protein
MLCQYAERHAAVEKHQGDARQILRHWRSAQQLSQRLDRFCKAALSLLSPVRCHNPHTEFAPRLVELLSLCPGDFLQTVSHLLRYGIPL